MLVVAIHCAETFSNTQLCFYDSKGPYLHVNGNNNNLHTTTPSLNRGHNQVNQHKASKY